VRRERIGLFALRGRVNELAAATRLPTMDSMRAQVADGGLAAYAASPSALWRRAAYFVDKVLRGAKAGDLPVEQPARFELLINARTAKALRLTIPPSVLGRADQMIE
jgi:putative tryptophan/tyrosine transport system substrate-binding protein